MISLVLNRLKKISFEDQSTVESLKSIGILNLSHETLMNLAHEIRNPLNILIGNLSLIEEKEIPIKLREILENIKICSFTMLHNLNNTLDVEKLERD